jgi:outer membrane receptor for monomeric catechols
VPREIMDQQNLLTMREVLSTLPGITFTAGEGGGGYGDGVNLRGYTASNDISTDGVRDSAQYSRTDPFNLEQLELVSGANSVYTGAGSVGGSINLVTKRPTGMPGTVLDFAGGDDSYARFTLDTESTLGDRANVRLNLMAHRNEVPGRDVERYDRDNGSGLRNPLGETPNPVLPPMSIANPDHFYAGPVNIIYTQRADGEVDNQAAYVFDQLDGNSLVDGVALGAAGAIGVKWSIFANYTYLDSEVVQSVSDQLLLGGGIDILAGDPLPNTRKCGRRCSTAIRGASSSACTSTTPCA